MTDPQELPASEKNAPDSRSFELLLRAALREVFSKLIPAELREIEPDTGGGFTAVEHRAYVESSVGIHGWCDGRVKLSCTREGAVSIARAMLQLDAGAEVTDADMSDAIAECAQAVGGVFRRPALDPMEFSATESRQLVWGLTGGGLSAIFHLEVPAGGRDRDPTRDVA